MYDNDLGVCLHAEDKGIWRFLHKVALEDHAKNGLTDSCRHKACCCLFSLHLGDNSCLGTNGTVLVHKLIPLNVFIGKEDPRKSQQDVPVPPNFCSGYYIPKISNAPDKIVSRVYEYLLMLARWYWSADLANRDHVTLCEYHN